MVSGTPVATRTRLLQKFRCENERLHRLEVVPAGAPGFAPAIEAILGADLVILGPGSLYTSILPNLLIDDIGAAVATRPMVVLVDRSGSMGGAPLEIACGVTIALAMVACREKRPVSVIFFDSLTAPAMRMHKPTPRALADLLGKMRGVYARGGTSFNAAFSAGLAELKELPRADMVFITDSRGETIRGRVGDRLAEKKA